MSFNSLVKAGALLTALAIVGAAAPAFAAGGSAPAADNNPPPTNTAECQKAKGNDWEWSKTEKKCVKKTALNDSELYQEGRALALAGHYEKALAMLNAIGNKNDAMVLTMIGYSTRKLGNTEAGIAIYHQALAIDPNNVNTHEYLGEGYLVAGRVDLAELELDTLQKLCGTGCEQYKDLQKALAGDVNWH